MTPLLPLSSRPSALTTSPDAKPTIGQDAAAAVVEVLADDQLAGRCTCGLPRAARVEQRGTAQVQPAVAGHGTAAVVDAFARAQPQHVIAGGGERAAGGGQIGRASWWGRV
ncbi:hypothetical protein G6F59_018087 [Rhizopus arrhizus]|nr:hypothetical protein G6F59_018087 [Rhizopus arrhizus]